MFNLVTTRNPMSFSAKLLFSWVASRIYLCMALFNPKRRTLQFLLNEVLNEVTYLV